MDSAIGAKIVVEDDDDVSSFSNLFSFSFSNLFSFVFFVFGKVLEFYLFIYFYWFLGLKEFDWEAAVREIDVACQTGKPSSSSCNLENHESEKKKKKNGSNSRQSTLHEFVGKEVPRPQKERSWDTVERGDERVCDVEIDAEAAKTWIYPGLILQSL